MASWVPVYGHLASWVQVLASWVRVPASWVLVPASLVLVPASLVLALPGTGPTWYWPYLVPAMYYPSWYRPCTRPGPVLVPVPDLFLDLF